MVPAWVDFGAMLGSRAVLDPSKSEEKNDTENETEKAPPHKPVNAWNGKRVHVETNVSIVCECPKETFKYRSRLC